MTVAHIKVSRGPMLLSNPVRQSTSPLSITRPVLRYLVFDEASCKVVVSFLELYDNIGSVFCITLFFFRGTVGVRAILESLDH